MIILIIITIMGQINDDYHHHEDHHQHDQGDRDNHAHYHYDDDHQQDGDDHHNYDDHHQHDQGVHDQHEIPSLSPLAPIAPHISAPEARTSIIVDFYFLLTSFNILTVLCTSLYFSAEAPLRKSQRCLAKVQMALTVLKLEPKRIVMSLIPCNQLEVLQCSSLTRPSVMEVSP